MMDKLGFGIVIGILFYCWFLSIEVDNLKRTIQEMSEEEELQCKEAYELTQKGL